MKKVYSTGRKWQWWLWNSSTLWKRCCGWKWEEWGELQCCDVDPVIVRERSSGDMEGGPAVVKPTIKRMSFNNINNMRSLLKDKQLHRLWGNSASCCHEITSRPTLYLLSILSPLMSYCCRKETQAEEKMEIIITPFSVSTVKWVWLRC